MVNAVFDNSSSYKITGFCCYLMLSGSAFAKSGIAVAEYKLADKQRATASLDAGQQSLQREIARADDLIQLTAIQLAAYQEILADLERDRAAALAKLNGAAGGSPEVEDLSGRVVVDR
jgi:hypothetical protein